MIVLGIHDGHGASACILQDGELKALASEERFSRIKSDYGYPVQAIDSCLGKLGLSPSEIDHVAFATVRMPALDIKMKSNCTFSNDDWKEFQYEFCRPRYYEDRLDNGFYERRIKDERFANLQHFYDLSKVGPDYSPHTQTDLGRAIRLEAINRHLGIAPEKADFYDHHACHAYYAFFGSHIRQDNSLIMTLDGGGDGTVSTVHHFKDGRITELARGNTSDVARIYRSITQIMGMKVGEHEYKVMGLAPYVTDREFVKSRQVFDGKFEIRNDLIEWKDKQRPKDLYFAVQDAFEGHRFDGIAAAVQEMAEKTVCAWFREVLSKYGSRHAVFGGGVAMNVKVNMLLADMEGLDDFYVCPSPTDDTLCVGACYMAEVAKDADSWRALRPISDVYVGPVNNLDSIARAIDESNARTDFRVEQGVSPTDIAELIDDGNVIARCSGGMEFGARALGNRSILADPRRDSIVEKINQQIKYRDFWMPFAPVVLTERARDYFVFRNASIRRPYMMIGAQTTELGRKELRGALHRADFTGRPQVLERQQNPGYYDIIKEFEARTGTGALLNTSFNLHGEPIVCTPADAIRTFQRSELDALLMEDILIRRP